MQGEGVGVSDRQIIDEWPGNVKGQKQPAHK